MNRTCHLRTDSRDTQVRAATDVSGATPDSSAQARTTRARSASACDGFLSRASTQSFTLSVSQQQRDKLQAGHTPSL